MLTPERFNIFKRKMLLYLQANNNLINMIIFFISLVSDLRMLTMLRNLRTFLSPRQIYVILLRPKNFRFENNFFSFDSTCV